MSTPQDPARRLKQKRRRETQLGKWRDKQAAAAGDGTKAAVPPAQAKRAAPAAKA